MNLPTHAEIIIVGGGIAGCSTAYHLALLGTLASLGSYGIALWAMTQAPVATVAALREASVLFAALLGAILFKEVFGLQRGAGTLLIVGGIASLKLG